MTRLCHLMFLLVLWFSKPATNALNSPGCGKSSSNLYFVNTIMGGSSVFRDTVIFLVGGFLSQFCRKQIKMF